MVDHATNNFRAVVLELYL